MRKRVQAVEVRAAVDAAEPRVLITALAYATGNLTMLERATQALGESRRGHQTTPLPDSLRDEITALVRKVVDVGFEPSLTVTDHDLGLLAGFCAGEEVPQSYLPLIREECNFDGSDPRRPRLDAPAPSTSHRGGLRVAIVGAGLGGVCAAIRLAHAGVEFVVLEKNAAVGGTWLENDYPDLRVDVPSHFYSYSFAPKSDWTNHYSRRLEIDAYIEQCVDQFDLRSHIRLDTEVISARFESDTASWVITVAERRDGAVTEHELRVNAIVSAVGMLNRPHVPHIEGLDTFGGPHFHSSRWDHGVDIARKRVGVVGTGASALQIVPAIASQVDRLHIFQRARHWALQNPKYLEPITEPERWLFANVPTYRAWYRFLLFWVNGDRQMPAFRIDPTWDDQTRSTSLANDKVRRRATTYICDQLDNDESLIERVLPDYPPFGKRILQDGGWYRTLQRDNVDLVTDSIQRVEPQGVRLSTDELVELDVLVLATGFHANRFLWPMDIVGRDGQHLHDVWGDDPRAHLGITIPGFPNLFCIYGPNTNPVVGSVVFMLECQVHYIVKCLQALAEGGWASMECRQSVHDAYNERVDAEHEQMVWRHPRVRSYYNNASGRVTTNAPWSLLDYWAMTHEPDFDDFDLATAAVPADASAPGGR